MTIMRLNSEQLKPILTQWIKWDADLYACLRDIQLKLLYDRVIRGMNYVQLGKIYKADPAQLRHIFRALLLRIEYHCNKQIGALLQQLNEEQEAVEQGKRGGIQSDFEFDKIFLN